MKITKTQLRKIIQEVAAEENEEKCKNCSHACDKLSTCSKCDKDICLCCKDKHMKDKHDNLEESLRRIIKKEIQKF